MNPVVIVGAGLAGSEAAWQLAKRGVPVTLIEMRPATATPAHKSDQFAELVCSNSFRGAALTNAVGLLKEELKLMDSLIMNCALNTEVPAGGCLAVDRDAFSALVTKTLREHPLIKVVAAEISELPNADDQAITIIATGPLTSKPLSLAIEKFFGEKHLAFFDAISPILSVDSIDLSQLYKCSRYGKGGSDDYWNIPLDRELYYSFVEQVKAAPKYSGNAAVENDSLERLRPFEGCMPIEDMIERGPETLRFGPFKPRGLKDPRTGREPYAVLQLRQDNHEGTLWSMVGMQTRMKRDAQEQIFKQLPGLQQAEFMRFGSVHRNTFINSPACLNNTLQTRTQQNLFFAGQVTGVEGYVESCASGLVAGINVAQLVRDSSLLAFPKDTAIGSLMNYISDPERKDFQPMNISFGLMPSYFEIPLKKGESKNVRRELAAKNALESIANFAAQIQ